MIIESLKRTKKQPTAKIYHYTNNKKEHQEMLKDFKKKAKTIKAEFYKYESKIKDKEELLHQEQEM